MRDFQSGIFLARPLTILSGLSPIFQICCNHLIFRPIRVKSNHGMRIADHPIGREWHGRKHREPSFLRNGAEVEPLGKLAKHDAAVT